MCLGGCTHAAATGHAAPQTPGPALSNEPQLVMSGWFHVIWNGEPKYMLIDDQGRWTRLLLDGSSMRPSGGPLALNRKRVKVVGVPVTSPSAAIRVVDIGLE